MSQFLCKSNQKNGAESFRPPIQSLPESCFQGFCFDLLKDFYQESRIQFQIYKQALLDEREFEL